MTNNPTAGKYPKVTADAVIIKDEKILLIKRGFDPFKGSWALPGGFIEYGETVEEATVREVKEETGLDVEPVKLIGVYSSPDRDPRFHTITIAYACRLKKGEKRKPDGGEDAEDAQWWHLSSLPKLAFDHAQMVKDALRGLK